MSPEDDSPANTTSTPATTSAPATTPSRPRRLWDKYGLIIVGNIVFFMLLYYFSYRPHNAENRAGELLSIAQTLETDAHHEASLTVYARVILNYPDTRAAQSAAGRSDHVRSKIARLRREGQGPFASDDMLALLDGDPTLLVADKLARQHKRVPDAQRPRYWAKLKECLRAVTTAGTATLDNLKARPAFADAAFQQPLFALQGACEMQADWYYDDFVVRNQNFYTWHNVIITLSLTQGKKQATRSLRIAELAPDAIVDVLEFQAQKEGGPITCVLKIEADEGQASTETRL